MKENNVFYIADYGREGNDEDLGLILGVALQRLNLRKVLASRSAQLGDTSVNSDIG